MSPKPNRRLAEGRSGLQPKGRLAKGRSGLQPTGRLAKGRNGQQPKGRLAKGRMRVKATRDRVRPYRSRDHGSRMWEPLQPVAFSERIAHEDAVVRQRALTTLHQLLASRMDFGSDEYVKLWQGLFFSLWREGRRSVHDELVSSISLLLRHVPASKFVAWVDAFLATMHGAWPRLAVDHMHRFLLLLRKILEEAFRALRLSGWRLVDAKALGEALAKLNPGALEQRILPNQAVLLQVLRLFWGALTPQLSEASPPAPTEAGLALLEPFCRLAGHCQTESVFQSLRQHVFRLVPVELCRTLSERTLTTAMRVGVPIPNRLFLKEMVAVFTERASRCDAVGSSSLFSPRAAGRGTHVEKAGSAPEPVQKVASAVDKDLLACVELLLQNAGTDKQIPTVLAPRKKKFMKRKQPLGEVAASTESNAAVSAVVHSSDDNGSVGLAEQKIVNQAGAVIPAGVVAQSMGEAPSMSRPKKRKLRTLGDGAGSLAVVPGGSISTFAEKRKKARKAMSTPGSNEAHADDKSAAASAPLVATSTKVPRLMKKRRKVIATTPQAVDVPPGLSTAEMPAAASVPVASTSAVTPRRTKGKKQVSKLQPLPLGTSSLPSAVSEVVPEACTREKFTTTPAKVPAPKRKLKKVKRQ